MKGNIFLLLSALCCSIFAASSQVKVGIEVLRESGFECVKGKRIALLTNQTGVDSALNSTVDILFSAEGVKLVKLFAPEHGVRGDVYAGKTVNQAVDLHTNLPVISLYGKLKRPTREMLSDVDAVVYDVQDVGARSYTFVSTLGGLIESCAEAGVELIVLDRPNPIGCRKVEGCGVKAGYQTFISKYDIPYIYGLTPGELALYLNGEGVACEKGKCKIHVVEMTGYHVGLKYMDTALKWVPTSPCVPSVKAAICYPMSGIVGELEQLNIGVGFSLPFETFAAPWINGDSLAMILNAKHLDGLQFRPITYRPVSHTHKGLTCSGVHVYVTNIETARLTEVQFHVLCALHEMYPSRDLFAAATDKVRRSFDCVCGTSSIRTTLQRRYRWSDCIDLWRDGEEEFKQRAAKYYIYQ